MLLSQDGMVDLTYSAAPAPSCTSNALMVEAKDRNYKHKLSGGGGVGWGGVKHTQLIFSLASLESQMKC